MWRNLIGTAALAVMATPAFSAVVTYTDRAAFNAAAGLTTTETFDSYAQDVPIGSGINVGPFTLSGTAAGQTAIDAGTTFYPLLSNGTPFVLVELGASQKLVFTFAAATTAFGLDLDGFNDTFGVSDIYVDGAALGVPVSAPTTVRFFGFTSSTAFNTVELRGNGDRFGLDNVTFVPGMTTPPGSSGTVPEPATWSLMLLGFGGIGISMRRRSLTIASFS